MSRTIDPATHIDAVSDEIPSSKVCTGCNTNKPLEEFWTDKRGRYGRCSKCGVCMGAQRAKWRTDNADKKRAYDAKHRANHKDRIAASNVKYRSENKEVLLAREATFRARPETKEYKARWQLENRDRQAKTNAAWTKRNPERKRAYRQRRRAKLAGIANMMPDQYWTIILGFYGGKCAQCGSTENLTHDHVVPISWEQSEHSLRNSQVLCVSHNSAKGNRRDTDYRDWSTGILAERIIS